MTRDLYIDCIGGIMILFMIIRHCLIPGHLLPASIEDVYLWYPLMFYMAWFFFKAGMYFKDDSLSQVLSKSFTRLLVPYFIFSILAIFIYGLCLLITDGVIELTVFLKTLPQNIIREGAFSCNAPLWFLLTLFFSRLFFSFSVIISIPPSIVCGVSALCGYFLHAFELPVGLYFGNIALGLAFFSAGYSLKERQFLKPLFICAICFYIGFLVYCFISKSPKSDFRTNIHSPYLLVVLFNLSGCILINNLFKRIPSLQLSLFSLAGRESMTLLTTHFIIIQTLISLNRFMGFHSNVLAYICLISLAILLPPIVKLFRFQKLKWMVGRSTRDILHLSDLNNDIAAIGVSSMAIVMCFYLFTKVWGLN